MSTPILMFALFPTMEDGTLAKWNVKAGYRAFTGGVIAEAKTEKATVEVGAFDWLDAPPVRVTQEDTPLPYAANLEAMSLPNADKIVRAVKAVMYRE